jgi:hypothetical protein
MISSMNKQNRDRNRQLELIQRKLAEKEKLNDNKPRVEK